MRRANPGRRWEGRRLATPVQASTREETDRLQPCKVRVARFPPPFARGRPLNRTFSGEPRAAFPAVSGRPPRISTNSSAACPTSRPARAFSREAAARLAAGRSGAVGPPLGLDGFVSPPSAFFARVPCARMTMPFPSFAPFTFREAARDARRRREERHDVRRAVVRHGIRASRSRPGFRPRSGFLHRFVRFLPLRFGSPRAAPWTPALCKEGGAAPGLRRASVAPARAKARVLPSRPPPCAPASGVSPAPLVLAVRVLVPPSR